MGLSAGLRAKSGNTEAAAACRRFAAYGRWFHRAGDHDEARRLLSDAIDGSTARGLVLQADDARIVLASATP